MDSLALQRGLALSGISTSSYGRDEFANLNVKFTKDGVWIPIDFPMEDACSVPLSSYLSVFGNGNLSKESLVVGLRKLRHLGRQIRLEEERTGKSVRIRTQLPPSAESSVIMVAYALGDFSHLCRRRFGFVPSPMIWSRFTKEWSCSSTSLLAKYRRFFKTIANGDEVSVLAATYHIDLRGLVLNASRSPWNQAIRYWAPKEILEVENSTLVRTSTHFEDEVAKL